MTLLVPKLAVALTEAAGALGPRLTGVLAVYPLYSTSSPHSPAARGRCCACSAAC